MATGAASDRELLDLLRNPEQQDRAFRKLTETYCERLYWHIRRLVVTHEDADDVLQNTLVKAWRSIGNFRADSGLYTWLYRIATNESLNLLKQKRQRFFLPLGDVNQHLLEALQTDNWFDGDEAQQRLQQAILKLPEKQRLVFNLKYFDEMKYEDMSEVLQTSVGALKASYHHAVKKIKQEINPD